MQCVLKPRITLDASKPWPLMWVNKQSSRLIKLTVQACNRKWAIRVLLVMPTQVLVNADPLCVNTKVFLVKMSHNWRERDIPVKEQIAAMAFWPVVPLCYGVIDTCVQSIIQIARIENPPLAGDQAAAWAACLIDCQRPTQWMPMIGTLMNWIKCIVEGCLPTKRSFLLLFFYWLIPIWKP